MDGFQSGETPLVLVRGQMDHRIPIHFPQEKATCSAYFEIQTQFFSLGKDQIRRSLLPPSPAWMDRDRQTNSPEDGVLFVVVIILELVGGAMAISFILHISKTIDPCLSQVLDPLQVILELQGKIISLQKYKSITPGL